MTTIEPRLLARASGAWRGPLGARAPWARVTEATIDNVLMPLAYLAAGGGIGYITGFNTAKRAK